jgi:cytochrome c biogenesis protein CcmG, thiol:disulfide interchange protein DsbE
MMAQCRPAATRNALSPRHSGLEHVLAALLIIAVCAPASAAPALQALIKPLDLVAYRPGTKPPDFSGPTVESQSLSLSQLRGKVVVVNFWASWCHECRPEMPALEQLHREFAGRGLAIIGINARENAETIRRYAKEVGLSFPLVLDPDGKINTLYGVIGLPATFVIGRDGRAVAFAIGARKWESVPARALIAALLAEQASR